VVQEMLKIRIRPLTTMECTIISSQYLELCVTEKTKKLINLKSTYEKLSGVLPTLRHNSETRISTECNIGK